MTIILKSLLNAITDSFVLNFMEMANKKFFQSITQPFAPKKSEQYVSLMHIHYRGSHCNGTQIVCTTDKIPNTSFSL
jgi:hypothetical protein